MKRKNIKSTFITVKAQKGVIEIWDGHTDIMDRECKSYSRHEWHGSGFIMTNCGVDSKPEEIPDSRKYVSQYGLSSYLSISQMLKSDVPMDAIKQAISK